jgi:hypothetical protein
LMISSRCSSEGGLAVLTRIFHKIPDSAAVRDIRGRFRLAWPLFRFPMAPADREEQPMRAVGQDLGSRYRFVGYIWAGSASGRRLRPPQNESFAQPHSCYSMMGVGSSANARWA